MKQQVIVIHGGTTFTSQEEYLEYLHQYEIDFARLAQKRWKDNLSEDLGTDFEIISPEMPNRRNANYLEWRIWFEKYIPLLRDNMVLVGHSLGGLFLAKYLSDRPLPVGIRAVALVAAPYDAEGTGRSLADFILPKVLTGLGALGDRVYLLQSRDDTVVRYQNLEKYEAQLPKAQKMIFTDRGHFDQEHFPELVTLIKKLSAD